MVLATVVVVVSVEVGESVVSVVVSASVVVLAVVVVEIGRASCRERV